MCCNNCNRGPQGIQGLPGECNCEIAFSSVERAPMITAVISDLTSASYTIPVGGNGNYRILYTGHADFLTVAGTVTLIINKNGVEITSIARRTITSGVSGFMLSFNIFLTNITLVAGDILSISGSISQSGIAIRNCILEISKI
jgi:hypothetical protein